MALTLGVGTEAPAPGIYEGIDNATYHRWDACNASRLKIYQAYSFNAERLRWELEHPAPPSEPKIFGQALHDRCESAEVFERRTIAWPDCNRAKNRKPWEDWIQNLEGAIGEEFRRMLARKAKVDEYPVRAWQWGLSMLRRSQYQTIASMGEDMARVPVIAKLWGQPPYDDISGAGAQREVCVVWVDDESDVLCKARIDVLIRWHDDDAHCGSIWDYKTVEGSEGANAGQESFRWVVRNWDYVLSMAHYCAGLAASNVIVESPTNEPPLNEPENLPVRLIAIDKQAPYSIGIHQMDERDLGEGHLRRRALIERYADLCKSRQFVGYRDTDGGEIMRLRVPSRSRSAEEILEDEVAI